MTHRLLYTGDEMGCRLLWDLAKLTLIRALSKEEGLISHVDIVPTSADLISVSKVKGKGSRISVETVNGIKVGCVETNDCVTALAVTSCPEGTAVNAFAVSFHTGVIRLYDLWTLAPFKDISHPSNNVSFISIVFADAWRKLYGVTEAGTVYCWEDQHQKHPRPPKYSPILLTN